MTEQDYMREMGGLFTTIADLRDRLSREHKINEYLIEENRKLEKIAVDSAQSVAVIAQSNMDWAMRADTLFHELHQAGGKEYFDQCARCLREEGMVPAAPWNSRVDRMVEIGLSQGRKIRVASKGNARWIEEVA